MLKGISGIYKITSPSGRFYVGSSTCMRSRWSGHRGELRNDRHHCEPVQNAARKYGIDSLRFEVIAECPVGFIRVLEQSAIEWLNPEYNASRCVREALTDLWKDPVFAAAHKLRATERLKRINGSKEMKEKAAEARRQRIAADRADPARWAQRNAKHRARRKPVLCVEAGIVFDCAIAAKPWLEAQGFRSVSQINNCISGRARVAYGYTWRYVEDARDDH